MVEATKLTPLEHKVAGMAVAFHPDEKAALLKRVEAIADSAFFLWGDQQEELQARFAKLIDRKHALVFNSVTAGFELLLRHLVATRGIEEVVFQANAFPSLVFAARRLGLEVGFVDLDLRDGGMSADALDTFGLLDARTVVVIQHTGGVISPDVAELQAIARKAGAFLVEDASQAVGSYGWEDAQANKKKIGGSWGDVALFSTSATKAFHTGQGGILATDDDAIEEYLRQVRQYGRTQMFQAGEFVVEGTNANQSEMNAAVGNVMLDTLVDRIAYRAEILAAYKDVLTDGMQIEYVLACEPNLYKLPIMPGPSYGWERSGVKAALKEANVQLGSEVYEWLTPSLPIFAGAYDDQLEALPMGVEWAKTHICLPMHNVMTPDDARAVGKLFVELLEG